MMCRMVGHRRSAKQAKFDFELQLWRSVCVQCREAIFRIPDGEWRLSDELQEAQQPQLS